MKLLNRYFRNNAFRVRNAFRATDLLIIFLTVLILGQLTGMEYLLEVTSTAVHIIAFCVIFLVAGGIFELYSLENYKSVSVTIKSVFEVSILSSVVYIMIPLITPSLPAGRLEFFIFFLAVSFSMISWRLLYRMMYKANSKLQKKSILLCNPDEQTDMMDSLLRANPFMRIIEYPRNSPQGSNLTRPALHARYGLNEIEQLITENRVSEIIVSPKVDLKFFDYYTTDYKLRRTPVRSFTEKIEEELHLLPIKYYTKDYCLTFPFSKNNDNRIYLKIFRLFDIGFSLVGLAGTALLMPFILIGNLFGNKGKLFYTQQRIGKNGDSFEIIKFRTMVADAEKDGAKFAQKRDPRITKFGRFLRKTRIDELPQLINVLKSEMSVIGPRPERPCFVNQISEIEPLYSIRHAVKPGLTGWAQIKYRYGSSFDDSIEKLKYDLYYIKHRDLIMDTKIFMKTIGTVLLFKGQ